MDNYSKKLKKQQGWVESGGNYVAGLWSAECIKLPHTPFAADFFRITDANIHATPIDHIWGQQRTVRRWFTTSDENKGLLSGGLMAKHDISCVPLKPEINDSDSENENLRKQLAKKLDGTRHFVPVRVIDKNVNENVKLGEILRDIHDAETKRGTEIPKFFKVYMGDVDIQWRIQKVQLVTPSIMQAVLSQSNSVPTSACDSRVSHDDAADGML